MERMSVKYNNKNGGVHPPSKIGLALEADSDASKYMTMKRILSIFICIKLAHVFNRTLNFNLNLFHICFVQQCIDEVKTTKTGQLKGKCCMFLPALSQTILF
jgi:hypothetical protein